MYKNIFLAICMVAMLYTAAFAASSDTKVITREYPWVMRSVAALGMGNAYYTKSDSKYAPFYNPAGLTRVKKWKVDLIPLTVGINDKTEGFARDLNDYDLDNNTKATELLVKHIGQTMHLTAAAYPGFTKKNFTAGIFTNGQVTAGVSNPTIPELDVDGIVDGGVVAGIGMSWLEDGRLQTGISARYQKRYNYIHSYTAGDIAAGKLDNIKLSDFDEGQGFFVDLGFIYNFWMNGLNPRIGAAVNNLGTNGMGDAEDLPYSVNVSFGISPSIGFVTTDFIIDVIDVTQNFDEDKDWGKRINMGAEIRFWERIALRTGIHQGYLTAGGGIDLNIVNINYAYYREEIGAASGIKEDERHVFELVFGF